MTRFLPSASALLTVALLAIGAPGAAVAAEQTGASDVFKGFGSNSKDPIRIDADSLEVLDKDQNAVFSGNVHVLQKDTTMKTQRLRVFYEGKATAGLTKPAAPAAGNGASDPSSQQIRRLEAEGKVLITQKDQTVVGDRGWFDIRSNTAEITGNVVMTQCKNVARGERLSIDLKSGQYRLHGTSRVQVILDTECR